MRVATRAWMVLVGLWVVLGAHAAVAAPRTATFDIATYQVPAGFTASTSNGSLTLRAVDTKAGTFALIVLVPSTLSAGSLEADFKAAWDGQVAPGFKITAAPQRTATASDGGWEATSGTAAGDANGTPAGVILVTMTGFGRAMNIIIVTNSEAYSTALDGFLTSVKLDATKAPKAAASDTTPKPAAPSAPSAPPAPPPVAPSASKAKVSTTFSDGWTATIESDWVEVTKGSARVRLHHSIAYDDASRANPAAYFWKKLIEPRYMLLNVAFYEYSVMNFPYYFAQGDAIDATTKQKGFMSLRIVSVNGAARAIEVFTPTKADFEALFPDHDKLAAILGANRFAIGKEVAGTWSGLQSSGADMYYTSTGGYAGMSLATISDVFAFSANGTYSSEHKGATGMVGSQTVFQVKHKGTYAVSAWELSVKNESGASVYSAYYEAVRGGVILHLQDKQYSGLVYTLARTK